MMFGGEAFGGGAGMYGCLRPEDSGTSEPWGCGGNEGVMIPFASLVYFGLSSQVDAFNGESGVVGLSGNFSEMLAGFSMGLSGVTGGDFNATLICGTGRGSTL